MNNYALYIYFVIGIKISFILMTVIHIILKAKGYETSDLDKNIVYWKERFEFIFISLMAILLIYIFNPIKERTTIIDKETKILLYLFGFVLLITAKWDVFLHDAKWFNILQSTIGKNK
jgi:hypothetical protein